MKSALIITYYWPPSGGAGVQRWVKFVKYFPSLGINPKVITVDPSLGSYPFFDNSLFDDLSPSLQVFHTNTFEPFRFYKFLTRSKEIPFSGFANESNPGLIKKVSRFIRGNLFIPDARIGWNNFAFNMASKIIGNEIPDVIITSSPPHSTQLVGMKLKNKFGIPWIADMRDPWTDIYYYKEMMHTVWAKRKDQEYEKNVLESADAVIVVSKHIRDMFLKKSHKLNPSKFFIIPNGYDDEDFLGPESLSEDEMNITYTGTMTSDYRPEYLINALKLLKEKYQNEIRFNFVGSLPHSLKQRFHDALGGQFNFIPHVKHSEVTKYMKTAYALLLMIPDNKNNLGILTGKLFEYLASRRPIIGIGPVNGEAAEIVRNCGAGIFFQYEEEKKIYDEIERLFLNWKIAKNSLFNSSDKYLQYSRKNQACHLSEIIRNILDLQAH